MTIKSLLNEYRRTLPAHVLVHFQYSKLFLQTKIFLSLDEHCDWKSWP